MKFFFPDSQDHIDPKFDFIGEQRTAGRMRLRDDCYAHEVFNAPPFDGILVSKAIVEGVAESAKTGKYSLAQKHRLLRMGVRDFFRLDDRQQTKRLKTMGDCGAFSYVKEDVPPFGVDEVIDFYEACGFDWGVSVDHVILGFDPSLDDLLPGVASVPEDFVRRQQITLDLASEFQSRHAVRKCQFEPIGVAQGWSPQSFATAVVALQKMGYRRIALGGMVPLKTPDILSVLQAVSAVRKSATEFHLLGITRTDHVEEFDRFGVTSFDTTSPLLRAFKDARHNYYTLTSTYTAIRIPQIEGNYTVERLIRSGQVNQDVARRLEAQALKQMRAYAKGAATLDDALGSVLEYSALVSETNRIDKTREADYTRTLTDRPWERCECEVCTHVGVEVIIFRGSERNKRRGFHNISVLYGRLHDQIRRMKRPLRMAAK